MKHALATCTVRGSGCSPPSRRFVRFGPAVHHRRFRTTPGCIAWPNRADVRSLHVERALSTVARQLEPLAIVHREATHGWPEHRTSRLAPRGAQRRSPNDPRHGFLLASVRRPGRPGSVAIDANRLPTARTSTPIKRRAALARNTKPCTKREGVSRAPSDSDVHVACRMGSHTNRLDRHRKRGQ